MVELICLVDTESL